MYSCLCILLHMDVLYIYNILHLLFSLFLLFHPPPPPPPPQSSLSSESGSESDTEQEIDHDAVVSSTVNEEDLPSEITTSRPSWLYRRSKTPTPPPGEKPRYTTCACTVHTMYVHNNWYMNMYFQRYYDIGILCVCVCSVYVQYMLVSN